MIGKNKTDIKLQPSTYVDWDIIIVNITIEEELISSCGQESRIFCSESLDYPSFPDSHLCNELSGICVDLWSILVGLLVGLDSNVICKCLGSLLS